MKMNDVSKGLERKVRRYSYNESLEAASKYFKGNELAADTWVGKYALKDSEGNLYELTPDDMHHRLAREFARVESKYPNPMSEDQIYSLLKGFKYIIPQGSPQAGIGNDLQVVSLSNCFVIGNEADSYGGIMKTDEEQVHLMKRRGGVGHDMSHLRPRRSPVKNSSLSSTGVPTFMERASYSTSEVAQEGRRGALMLTLSIRHPDAEGFADAKMEKGKVSYANVSLKVDDEFMNAVREGRPYTQQFPINSKNPRIKNEIDARKLWEKIIHNAWSRAEPGILFWDTIIRESVSDCYAELGFKTTATNPCGEIPLPPYDSCRLLAKNLLSYVKNPFTPQAGFDFPLFSQNARYALRMMDDIVDLEIEKIDQIINKIDSDPEPEEIKFAERKLWEKIRDTAVRGRRTGLGITGEGDMLAALGLRYGSAEATAFSEEVHKTLAIEAYRESVNLAKERGKFPIYDAEREKNNPFIKRIREADKDIEMEMSKHGRRNIQLLTIAPTGSVSIETQTTSGLENLFDVIYQRRRKVNPNDKNVRVDFVDEETGNSWQHYDVLHEQFSKWLEVNGYDTEKVFELYKNGKKNEFDEIVKKSPWNKAMANDVNWIEKVRMQGAIQKWVDHSISVTVNLPKDISEEKVREVYMTAWEAGCKGITVYRAGSRSGVLIEKERSLEKMVELVQFNVKNDPRLDIRDQALKYRVRRPQNKDSLHVIVTSDLYVNESTKKAYFVPVEIFQERAPLGDSSSVSFQQSGIDRTEILRGDNPDYVELITRWQSASSNEEEGLGPKKIKSIEHAVGLVMENCLLANGIIGYDASLSPPQLVNIVRKRDLRKVERGVDEWHRIMSQVRVVHTEKELEASGTNGIKGFKCPKCGSREIPIFEAGCNKPRCADCGWGEDCG